MMAIMNLPLTGNVLNNVIIHLFSYKYLLIINKRNINVKQMTNL
jgi:hypothetical protein